MGCSTQAVLHVGEKGAHPRLSWGGPSQNADFVSAAVHPAGPGEQPSSMGPDLVGKVLLLLLGSLASSEGQTVVSELNERPRKGPCDPRASGTRSQGSGGEGGKEQRARGVMSHIPCCSGPRSGPLALLRRSLAVNGDENCSTAGVSQMGSRTPLYLQLVVEALMWKAVTGVHLNTETCRRSPVHPAVALVLLAYVPDPGTSLLPRICPFYQSSPDTHLNQGNLCPPPHLTSLPRHST